LPPRQTTNSVAVAFFPKVGIYCGAFQRIHAALYKAIVSRHKKARILGTAPPGRAKSALPRLARLFPG